MAVSGPHDFGTFGNDFGVGGVSWSNEANAATSNDTRATASLNAEISYYLYASDVTAFDAIPLGATIDGIVVEVEKSTDGGGGVIVDNSVRLFLGGIATGSDKASGSAWPTTDGTVTYGGAADKWGLTPTLSDIKDPGFGVGIAAEENLGIPTVARIDHIRITVHYTSSTGGSLVTSKLAGGSLLLRGLIR